MTFYYQSAIIKVEVFPAAPNSLARQVCISFEWKQKAKKKEERKDRKVLEKVTLSQ